MDYQTQTARIMAVLLAVLLCLPLSAAAVTDLFESEQPVENQTAGVREAAFRKALSAVLVRVTGDSAVPGDASTAGLLASPEQLVQQYRYFTEPSGDTPALMLWVRFDGDAIRRALQPQGQSWWGGERPDTVVWLAVEDRGRRYLVASDGSSDVHAQINRAARQRGVPILFPLMDIEDQQHVSFSDVWGGYFDKVMQAAQRYNSPAVLVGRLNRSPSGGWSSRWYLNVSGQVYEWTDSNQRLDALARQGIDDVADQLASRFAVAGNGAAGQRVSIIVGGIDSLAAYARVSRYLDSLTQVSGLQVAQVTPTDVGFTMYLNGSLQDLSRIVSIGKVLEPVNDGQRGRFRIRR